MSTNPFLAGLPTVLVLERVRAGDLLVYCGCGCGGAVKVGGTGYAKGHAPGEDEAATAPTSEPPDAP